MQFYETEWIVCRFMEVVTRCNLLCVWCISVCNVAHEWVPYPFSVIAMCNSNICIHSKLHQHPSHRVNNFIKLHVNKLQSQTKKRTMWTNLHCMRMLFISLQLVPCIGNYTVKPVIYILNTICSQLSLYINLIYSIWIYHDVNGLNVNVWNTNNDLW